MRDKQTGECYDNKTFKDSLTSYIKDFNLRATFYIHSTTSWQFPTITIYIYKIGGGRFSFSLCLPNITTHDLFVVLFSPFFQYEFKIKGIVKRRVNVIISVDGIKVTVRKRRRRMVNFKFPSISFEKYFWYWIRKRRCIALEMR